MIVKTSWEVMAKLVKHSPEEKLKAYLRRKYMRSSIMSDRITEDADWKDGMDTFRIRTHQDLEEIHKILLKIQEKLDEHPLGVGFAQKDFK